MPGAKMIFNARYFHIAKPGENLSKHALHKNAAAGLVDYIATRESVVRNFTPEYELMNVTDLQRAKIHEFIFDEPEIKQLKEFKEYGKNPTAANATRFLSRASSVMAGIDTGEDIPIDGSPATEKQKERIEEFLSAVPELKESMEYKDYLYSPTFNNASEFLSNAFDNSLGSVVDPETLYTMVNYMATRPGVVKDGEHGLFSSDDVTDLEAYKKEVSEHTGNIYSTVVSLRREDADALGFDSQENWKNAVKAKLDVVAKNSGIPLNDLRWCAAMHNTGHHPHIHLMYWSKNPSTQNYLSKQGIEKIKSAFAHEIFRGEFEQIYEVQKDLTQELKKESETLLHNLKEHSAEYAKDPALLQKFSELSSDLSELKGKHQYKYLPKRLKEQVNDLVDQIGEIPEMKRLHELYEENNNKMLSIYKESENIPQRKLSEVKSGDNLYFLKNMVIKAAEGISIPKEILPEFDSSPEEQDFEAPPAHDMESAMLIRQLEDLSADGDKESAMMLGDIYAEGLGGISPDADQAVMWYGIAANDYGGETLPLAAYKLSQIMPEIDEFDNNLAHEFAYRATIGFQKELEQSPNTNLIGDLLQGKYSYASREEYHRQQFEELQKLVPNLEYEPPTVYQDSPENAERLFYLAKLYTEDHLFHLEDSHLTAGNAKDTEKAKSLYQLAFDLGYHPAAYTLSRMGENPKQELAWLLKGAEKGDHDCTVKAAQLLKSGENGIQDLALSDILYQKLQSKSQSSENRSEEKTSKGTSENIPRYTSSEKQASALYQKGKELAADKETASQAFSYFKQSADLGYSWAQYKTAEYIYKGLTDLKRSEVHPYFQLARENFQKEEAAGKKNAWRDYVVAGMYQKGLGTPADEKQAYEYYSKALQGFLSSGEMPPWKEYIVGRMFGYGLGTDVNPEESFIYTRRAAEHGHSRAMYDTAGNYLHGKGVDANPAEAQKYYALALKEFIKADKKTPDEWQEYTIGRMFANGLGTQEDPAQAFVYYKQSADNGHTKAAYETAKHYAEGKGIAQNPVLAQQYYQKALEGFLLEVKDSHDPQTEYLLATMYREGLGTEKNPEKAFEHLIKAAESGNGQIQYQAAEYLEKGIGTESNPALANKYYTEALMSFIAEDREHPNAWKESVIAKMYEKGLGTAIHFGRAFEYYKLAADNGHTQAQYKTAEMLMNGTGTEKNPDTAQFYYAKALDGFILQNQENPDEWLQYRIASMYEKGLGTTVNPAKAFEYYKLAADNGHTQAQYKTAEMLMNGTGTEKNPDTAQSYYAKALDGFILQNQENPDEWLQYRIASMYEKGLGTTVNPGKSFEYYKLAADNGHTQAQYKTAEMLMNGSGTERNPDTAQSYYAKALDGFIRQNNENPDEWLQYRIASMYEKGLGTTVNSAKAFEYYKLAADNGHTQAQYKTAEMLMNGTGAEKNPDTAQFYYAKALDGFILQNNENPDEWLQYRIASMYEKGLGTTVNPEKAFEYYKLAADNGHTQAQYRTAEMLMNGSGTERNPDTAQFYYAKALDGFILQNNENPDEWLQYRIASMYEKGLGTAIHFGRAFEYYKLAADNGHTQAQYKVGEAYRNGNGVPVNDTLSQRYFKKAFDGFMEEEKINPDSYLEYQIGRMYQKGLGVEKDTEQAKEWYQKSADKGNEYAKQALERMENQQSTQQSQSSSALQSLLSMIASQMHQENLQQTQNRRPTIDRKERRKIREKKHEIGLKEDWEQSLE